MQIDDKLIPLMEKLSFISLSDSEKSRMAEDLEYFSKFLMRLDELDTQGIPGCSRSYEDINVFRDDEILASYDRELILKNAPERNDEMIIAPKTVE